MDSSNAVVPHAVLTLKNVDTGIVAVGSAAIVAGSHAIVNWIGWDTGNNWIQLITAGIVGLWTLLFEAGPN